MGTRVGSRAGLAIVVVSALLAARAAAVQVVHPETAVSSASYGPMIGVSFQTLDLACAPGACLEVWRDSRLGYGIAARRFGADGSPTDRATFEISADALGAEYPSVATDGSRFVVAWSDGVGHLYATRVDPDGSTHTTSSKAVTGVPSGPSEVAIAFGGGGYLAVFTAGSGAFASQVYGLRLDADGNFLDSQPFPIGNDPSARGSPDVIWTGNQFLVVWVSNQSTTSYAAVGARVLRDGTVLDPLGFFVTVLNSGFSAQPQLAFGAGTVLLVAARQPGSSGGGVDAVLLDANGKSGRLVSLPFWSTASQAAATATVVWNGTSFTVAWIQGTTGNQTVAARVGTDGTVLDTAGVLLTPSSFSTPTNSPTVGAVLDGTSYVAYVDHTYPNDTVRLVSLSATGGIGHQADPPLSITAAPQRLLGTARGSGQTLFLWSEEAGGASAAALEAARVSDDGTVLDATPIVISASGPNKTHTSVSAAWGSGVYLVAWWEETDLVNGQIQVARVSADGQVLDAAPAVLATNLFSDYPTQVAAGPNGFLVTWSRAAIISTPTPPAAQLVGADGKPVGSTFRIGPAQASWPYATLGLGAAGYLSAWTRFDSGNSGIQMAMIDPTGTAGPPVSATSLQATQALALISMPTQILLWVNGRSGVLTSSATPLSSPAPPFTLATNIGTPSWNGVSLTSAAPATIAVDFNQPIGVNASLLLLDFTTPLVATTPVVDALLPTSSPTAVGIGGGQSLIAYSRLVPEAGFGEMRVRFQIVDNSIPPPADGGSPGNTDGGAGSDAPGLVSDAGGDVAPDAGARPDAGAQPDAGAPPDARLADGGDVAQGTDAAFDASAADGSDAGYDAPSKRTDSGGCSCAMADPSSDYRGSAVATATFVLAFVVVRRRRRGSL